MVHHPHINQFYINGNKNCSQKLVLKENQQCSWINNRQWKYSGEWTCFDNTVVQLKFGQSITHLHPPGLFFGLETSTLSRDRFPPAPFPSYSPKVVLFAWNCAHSNALREQMSQRGPKPVAYCFWLFYSLIFYTASDSK